MNSSLLALLLAVLLIVSVFAAVSFVPIGCFTWFIGTIRDSSENENDVRNLA